MENKLKTKQKAMLIGIFLITISLIGLISAPYCGDGILQVWKGEECDDYEDEELGISLHLSESGKNLRRRAVERKVIKKR